MASAKKSETQVVAAKEETRALAPVSPTAIQGIIPEDIVIPKVLLMQGLSELVKNRKAQLGDIVRSTTGEKLGHPEQKVEFIPLSVPESFWIIEVNTSGKFEYKKMVKRDSSNSGMLWNFTSDKDGNEVPPGTANSFPARRVQRLAFYALLPGDIEADAIERKKAEAGEFPDFSKALMPVLIACRSLSFKAGKEVVTFFTQAAAYGQPAWKGILKLGCHLEQNDKGSFYVFDVDRSRPTPVPKEHLGAVEAWANIVARNADKLKIDESQDEDSASGVSSATQTAF